MTVNGKQPGQYFKQVVSYVQQEHTGVLQSQHFGLSGTVRGPLLGAAGSVSGAGGGGGWGLGDGGCSSGCCCGDGGGGSGGGGGGGSGVDSKGSILKCP